MSTACDLNRPKKFSSSVGQWSIISKLLYLLSFFFSFFFPPFPFFVDRKIIRINETHIFSIRFQSIPSRRNCFVFYTYISLRVKLHHTGGCIITRYIRSPRNVLDIGTVIRERKVKVRRWKHLKSVRSPGTPRKSCAPLLAPFHVPPPAPPHLSASCRSLFVPRISSISIAPARKSGEIREKSRYRQPVKQKPCREGEKEKGRI